MRTIYLIGFKGIAGGHKVIFEQVNRLIERGHEVMIFSILGEAQAEWFPLKTKIQNISYLEKESIEETDILVATSSATAVVADHFKKGIPFYFIQGYEASFSNDPNYKRQCEDSYRLPLNILVHSNWLRDLFRAKFNRQSHLIPIGIDLNHFKPINVGQSKNKKVLMVYSSHPIKGSRFGLEAFKLVKDRYPNVELVMFGLEPPPEIDFAFTYFQNPPQEEIPTIYSSCDIFVLPSIMEGLSLPPLEAMACKRSVVVTDCLGTREYAVDGKTAIVVPPKNSALLSEAIIRLLEDELLRDRLSESGYQEVKKLSWDRAIDRLEEIFHKAIEICSKRPSREYLDWERVLMITQDDPWAHYKLGIALYSQKDPKGAQLELEEAIRLDPDLIPAYKSLAILFSEEENPSKSLTYLKRAKERLMAVRKKDGFNKIH